MSSFMSSLNRLARSPKGRRMFGEAQKLARDPETRRKLSEVRARLAKRR